MKRSGSFWFYAIIGILWAIVGVFGMVLKWTGQIEVETDPFTFVVGAILFLHLASDDDRRR